MIKHAMTICVGILARALVLLAFSEFLFFNEGPVGHFLGAPDAMNKALQIAELIVFYCLPGSLLLALEPMMTSWPRTILAGAFVGWSIEAAMVPVAYENVPFSFFWTSVSWHAMIDVCVGWVFLRRVMITGTAVSKIIYAVVLGFVTAIWSTWAWSDLAFEIAQFAEIFAVALALIGVGYFLSTLNSSEIKLGQVGFWIAVGVNFAMWAIWATAFLPLSLGLLVLAAFNGWVLKGAAVGKQSVNDQLYNRSGLWSLLLAVPCAVLGFWLIDMTGASTKVGELAVLFVAFGGTLIYCVAVYFALRSRVQK